MLDTRRVQTVGAPLVMALCMAVPTFAQQAPRDGRRAAETGTSAVSGIVLVDDVDRKPLRRARVMLNGAELSVGRTVITNDDGTFSIGRLPAGRYTVAAAKEGYVQMQYGARRPNRAGSAIVLREGESRTVTLRIPRGGVITGTLVDAEGQPVSGVSVYAMSLRFTPADGERRMTPAGQSTTDDRGSYRIFGLAAGEYFVAANPRNTFSPDRDLQTLSQTEIKRALAEVRQAAAGRTQPGPSSSSPDVVVPTGTEPRGTVTLVPTFYPGTVDSANAAAVTVKHGEERNGVDFQIQYVRTATVTGVVTSQSAQSRATMALTRTDALAGFGIMRSTGLDGYGRFTLSGIPPGKYTVTARESPGLWAAAEIVVDGDDVSGVNLMMQPGLTVSGRIEFEGTKPPPDLMQIRVGVPAMSRTMSTATALPAVQMQPERRFTMAGIVPGLYRFINMMQGVRAPVGGWWLKSVTLGGRELLDGPMELRQNATDAVVTFSDRATELTGRVADERGNPASHCVVVVFGADKTLWFVNSRRVVGERPDAEGRYTIRNLPPGEYLMIVSDDLEHNEWFDPAVLEKLAPAATRILLGKDEAKKQDWMIPATRDVR